MSGKWTVADERSCRAGGGVGAWAGVIGLAMLCGCLSPAGVGQVGSPGAGRQETRQQAGAEAVSNQQRGLVNVQKQDRADAGTQPGVSVEAGDAPATAVTTNWQGLDLNTVLLLMGVTILVSQLLRDTIRGLLRLVVQLVGSNRKTTGGVRRRWGDQLDDGGGT